MKGIFKFMTAAAVSTAMVACTDDLITTSNGDFQSDADLVGTLNDARPVFTRMGMSEIGTAPWEEGASTWGLVWTKGDQVRVFTLDQLKYNYYSLKDASANQPKGEFDIMSGTKLEGDKKFAITDAQFVYGVSATSDGQARLTYTIPYRWKAQSIDSDEDGVTDVRKFPAPYWGRAEETSDGKINVGFSAMTAFLRIELDKLPAGTKKIVLTTHGNPYTVMDKDATNTEYTVGADGFQVTDDATILAAVNDGTETNYTWSTVDRITSGANEPLSGTFNTLLKAGATLAPDNGINEEGLENGTELFSRLTTRDEIIVDITATTPKVFYVPVIAQDYKNLHVIAAKAISKYSYRYVGTELKTFNQPFERGHYYFLTMSMLNLGTADATTVNAALDATKGRTDRTTVLNIDELRDVDYSSYTDAQWNTLASNISELIGKNYTGAQIKAMKHDRILIPENAGNVELNIAKITATSGAVNGYSPVRNDLGFYGTNKVLFVTDNKTAAQATDAKNSIAINLPHQIGATPDVDADYELLANLPTYNTIIGSSVDGKNLKNLVAFVQGSLTRCVTGHNVLVDDKSGVEDVKESALTMLTGVKDLVLLAGSKGDIYMKNTGAVDEYQPEINHDLSIQTREPINIRVDNALVNNLCFVELNPAAKDYVFSTGSTAFKEVKKVTVNTNKSTTVATGNPDVVMHSYWTGAALTKFATQTASGGVQAENLYDQEKVYTVAQLASVGELDQAKYYIDEVFVNDMWLGGDNSEKQLNWIGAQATVANFEFDGRNVPLRKMSMNTIAGKTDGSVAYVDDPHLCCTTCGFKPAVYSSAAGGTTAVTSFGLIRSYVNAGSSATIKNVALDDVLFEDNSINNIGAVIGYVEATDLTLDKNSVTDPKINLKGNNIGGVAGYVNLSGNLTATDNTVSESGQEATNKVVSEGNLVGGLIGLAEVRGTTGMEVLRNTVDLSGDVAAGGNFAGGLFGRAYGTSMNLRSNTVDLGGDIAAGKEYAGGLAGVISSIDAASVITLGYTGAGEGDVVKAANIKAQNGSYAGGFVGNITAASSVTPAVRVNNAKVTVPGEISATKYYAGGLIGSLATDAAGENRLNSAIVKVGTIAATEGFAGGELGYAKAGKVNFGRAAANFVTEVEVNKIKGAYAMGGLLGSNSNNSEIKVLTGKYGTEADPENSSIKITIKDWENTKKDNFATYFGPSDAEAQRAGNISNVIGLLEGKPIEITEAKDFAGNDLLIVTDYLNAAKKVALGFKFHRDEYWTTHQDTEFWGDYNGYVGYGGATYKINGTPVVAHTATGYNLFKNAATYSETSKLPQGM